MFESLKIKLSEAFSKLSKKGILSESDITEALRSIRISLLEADCALPVVKAFIDSIQEKAKGQGVFKSIEPAQMMVKITHDALVEVLGQGSTDLTFSQSPSVYLMVGLQGSGKTTSSAKLALWLKEKKNKKVMMASLDIYRPAAQLQLEKLGAQINVETLAIQEGQKPLDITKRALDSAKRQGYDVLILDTAGRLHLDQELMDEVESVAQLAKPVETLLVVDSMMGQDAVRLGSSFQEKVPLTGFILTRMDGDSRAGAALSLKYITKCPIKLVGVGEKVTQLEVFHPERLARRLLDMGDIVTLVEKAQEAFEEEEDLKLQKRLEKGVFNLTDFRKSLSKMQKMGGVQSFVSLLPGLGNLKGPTNIDDKAIRHQCAIIDSMTPYERRNPKILNASRKKRIASGCGLDVASINRLLKQFEQMSIMMKRANRLGEKGLKRGGLSSLLGK